MRANDVTCGVDESTLSVIDTTIGTNECTFSANEQQKVYLRNNKNIVTNATFDCDFITDVSVLP
jgi:hypothetical protein